MTTRTAAAALVLATLMGCSLGQEPDPDPSKPDGYKPDNRDNAFIITLAPKTSAARVAADYGIEPEFVYSHVMDGFAGHISEAARAGLLKDARVVRIDPDQVFAVEGGGVQPAAPWGLDRIDQRSATDGRFSYGASGKGVTAYIIDTGLRYSHSDFGGRAHPGFDAFGGDGSDCHGHGTHVGGTVGGTVYGVAKEVSLVAVRVLSCTGAGTTATVVAGLDWVAAQSARPAVANMSIVGFGDEVVDAAVRRVIAQGIPVVAAAGNSTLDACFWSPARVTEAMTIGASDSTDVIASFSNYGTCVDWYAPGVAVRSAAISSDVATALMSGTSMASPHSAGAVAAYLELNPGATPQQAATALAEWSTKDVVTGVPSLKGPAGKGDLLYLPPGSGNTGNNWPAARFVVECADLLCQFTDQSVDSDGTIASWEWSFGDQQTATTQHPSHTYQSAGVYRVTLTVKDNSGASATTAQDIAIGNVPQPNQPPAASFAAACVRLSCDFVDASTDPDGQVARWEWRFGDGASAITAAGSSLSHVFEFGALYRVSLTVTDDQGATSTTTKTVPVGVVLSGGVTKVKGKNSAQLAWIGAETATVDIFLNGTKLATISNTGRYTHAATGKGQPTTYTFRVCEAGLSAPMCSSELKLSM
jgi:subtilisin family serine protease